jgi:hypothetical protein
VRLVASAILSRLHAIPDSEFNENWPCHPLPVEMAKIHKAKPRSLLCERGLQDSWLN